MTLHIEWMRFKRECLDGRSKAEVSAARDMWYSGALAATDALLKLFHDDARSIKERMRSINAVATEARHFQESVVKRAKK